MTDNAVARSRTRDLGSRVRHANHYTTKPAQGTGDRRGSGMVQFKRALASSYRLFIVTFPLSLHVSEILPHLAASAPLFSNSTSSLPKISPCSAGTRWMTFGPKSEGVELIVRAISFQDFQPVVLIHQRHRQTDRQTDG